VKCTERTRPWQRPKFLPRIFKLRSAIRMRSVSLKILSSGNRNKDGVRACDRIAIKNRQQRCYRSRNLFVGFCRFALSIQAGAGCLLCPSGIVILSNYNFHHSLHRPSSKTLVRETLNPLLLVQRIHSCDRVVSITFLCVYRPMDATDRKVAGSIPDEVNF
jgi:hypothetical protein